MLSFSEFFDLYCKVKHIINYDDKLKNMNKALQCFQLGKYQIINSDTNITLKLF